MSTRKQLGLMLVPLLFGRVALSAAIPNAEQSNAQLSNAQLSNAQLSNAQLSNAQLSNAQLSNAQLSNAQLSNAQLSNAQLSNAQLSNAQLSNAQLSNAQLSNAQLSNAQLSNAQLSNAAFADAQLLNNPFLGGFTDSNAPNVQASVQFIPALTASLKNIGAFLGQTTTAKQALAAAQFLWVAGHLPTNRALPNNFYNKPSWVPSGRYKMMSFNTTIPLLNPTNIQVKFGSYSLAGSGNSGSSATRQDLILTDTVNTAVGTVTGAQLNGAWLTLQSDLYQVSSNGGSASLRPSVVAGNGTGAAAQQLIVLTNYMNGELESNLRGTNNSDIDYYEVLTVYFDDNDSPWLVPLFNSNDPNDAGSELSFFSKFDYRVAPTTTPPATIASLPNTAGTPVTYPMLVSRSHFSGWGKVHYLAGYRDYSTAIAGYSFCIPEMSQGCTVTAPSTTEAALAQAALRAFNLAVNQETGNDTFGLTAETVTGTPLQLYDAYGLVLPSYEAPWATEGQYSSSGASFLSTLRRPAPDVWKQAGSQYQTAYTSYGGGTATLTYQEQNNVMDGGGFRPYIFAAEGAANTSAFSPVSTGSYYYCKAVNPSASASDLQIPVVPDCSLSVFEFCDGVGSTHGSCCTTSPTTSAPTWTSACAAAFASFNAANTVYGGNPFTAVTPTVGNPNAITVTSADGAGGPFREGETLTVRVGTGIQNGPLGQPAWLWNTSPTVRVGLVQSVDGGDELDWISTFGTYTQSQWSALGQVATFSLDTSQPQWGTYMIAVQNSSYVTVYNSPTFVVNQNPAPTITVPSTVPAMTNFSVQYGGMSPNYYNELLLYSPLYGYDQVYFPSSGDLSDNGGLNTTTSIPSVYASGPGNCPTNGTAIFRGLPPGTYSVLALSLVDGSWMETWSNNFTVVSTIASDQTTYKKGSAVNIAFAGLDTGSYPVPTEIAIVTTAEIAAMQTQFGGTIVAHPMLYPTPNTVTNGDVAAYYAVNSYSTAKAAASSGVKTHNGNLIFTGLPPGTYVALNLSYDYTNTLYYFPEAISAPFTIAAQ